MFNQKLEPVLELMAFNTKFGANTVSADIDGDGYDEIIVSEGPGPNNSATLKAFKRDGTFITEYTAFNTKSGLTIASGDIDGDWKDEIIAGTGPGLLNPAAIKILKYNGSGFTDMVGPKLVSLTLLGVNVATGDVDGDGKPEIITAPGPALFNPAIIKVWKFENGDLTELYDFRAFDNKFYGVNIAVKDLDGDGIAEIIAGAGSGLINEALVKVFKGAGTPAGVEFNAYPNTHNGVQVAAGDVNGDGTTEIITGIGPGLLNTSWVKIFSPDGTELTGFFAYPNNIRFGVKVSAGNMGE
uniref:FG-GAP repeat protein n=1 Tax=uncultured Desulfobacterium sp. TaxID=201089 RepID=E1YAP5_9BACT|nr:hypothetical protein N47_H24610 [uncultured Desulfobacterium sp.]